MPSTSVHLPEDLLEALNRLAAKERIPRNRIIVDAIREAVERRSRRWPEGYFEGAHLADGDLAELETGAAELDRQIRAERRSSTRAPF